MAYFMYITQMQKDTNKKPRPQNTKEYIADLQHEFNISEARYVEICKIV